MLKQKEQGLLRQFSQQLRILPEDPLSLSMRITTQAFCVDYTDHLGKEQGAIRQTGDLFSCCHCSALVSHQQSPSTVPRAASPTQVSKPPNKLQGGKVPPCPVHTQIESKLGPHPTPFRKSQEPLLDNAAVLRKAMCNTANHFLNKQQQNLSV